MPLSSTRSLLSISIVITLAFGAAAQDIPESRWQKDRGLYQIDSDESEYTLYYLSQESTFDYRYGEDGSLICFERQHKIIRVQDEDALEQVNRIYVPIKDVIEVVDIRARTILPNGDIITFDQDNIKEVKDDESGGGYQIFAIEGAETGGEVEYEYTLKKEADLFGRQYLQSQDPIRESFFRLSCPVNLSFDLKTYNFTTTLTADTLDGIRTYTLYEGFTDVLREEEFSSYNSHRKRLEYKLAYNSFAGPQRLFTWADAASRIYGSFYTLDNKEEKTVKKIIKNVSLSGDTESRVRNLENYFKQNFYYEEQTGLSENLADVAEQKFSSKRGIARLFINLLEEAQIAHQLVVTLDRTNLRLDPSMESWNYLDEFLIYFPEIGQYLTPTEPMFRLGTINPELTANYGLIIYDLPYQELRVPVGDIVYIPPAPYGENMDNLDVQVKLRADEGLAEIELSRIYQGMNAHFLKYYYPLVDQQNREKIINDQVQYIAPDADIKNVEVNEEAISPEKWDEPLVITSRFLSEQFLEFAGSTLLLKIGQMIGPQSELYQDKVRQTPVENEYNRGYKRNITIDIPEGYTISNPEILTFDESATSNGEVVYLFKSTYELSESQLQVEIDEYYNQIRFPLERFEDFRTVINAAADWNKLVLVLEEK